MTPCPTCGYQTSAEPDVAMQIAHAIAHMMLDAGIGATEDGEWPELEGLQRTLSENTDPDRLRRAFRPVLPPRMHEREAPASHYERLEREAEIGRAAVDMLVAGENTDAGIEAYARILRLARQHQPSMEPDHD